MSHNQMCHPQWVNHFVYNILVVDWIFTITISMNLILRSTSDQQHQQQQHQLQTSNHEPDLSLVEKQERKKRSHKTVNGDRKKSGDSLIRRFQFHWLDEMCVAAHMAEPVFSRSIRRCLFIELGCVMIVFFPPSYSSFKMNTILSLWNDLQRK